MVERITKIDGSGTNMVLGQISQRQASATPINVSMSFTSGDFEVLHPLYYILYVYKYNFIVL